MYLIIYISLWLFCLFCSDICCKYRTRCCSWPSTPLNAEVAAEAEKVLLPSLSYIEDISPNGDGNFLLRGLKPSIADLCLVCEIMQLEATRFMRLKSQRKISRKKKTEIKDKCSQCYFFLM